jgi:predicted dehydrogenase/nucleoside-diphosphate-sugar epimerase
MRVVVVGCGLIAQEHLRSIRRCPEVEIVGIADPNPVVLQATADTFAVEDTFADPRAMIAQQKPDVVHVATPPGNHEEMVRFALESGCHVYVEKPITLRAPEAEALVALAESKGLLLCVGYMHNFDQAVLEARRLYEAGDIGTLCGIESYYGFDMGESPGSRYYTQAYTTWAYDLPGGLFQNGFDHPLSVMMPFFGEPKTLHALAADVGVMPKHVPGELRLLMSDGNCLASVTLSEAASPRFHYMNLLGSKATLHVDLQNKRVIRWGHTPGIPHFVTRFGMNLSQANKVLKGTAATVWSVARGRFTPYEGMQRLIPAFYEAIESGGPSPLPTEYAIRIMKIMDETWKQIEPEHEPLRWIQKERRPPGPGPAARPRPGGRKVLVTGGTGFIGARLVKQLLARGDSVRVLARNLRKAEPLSELGAEILVGNLWEPEILERAVEGVEVVFHLGATMGGKWNDFVQGTVQATGRLIDAARKAGVKRIVYASTIAVYGVPRPGRGQTVGEDHPLAERDLNDYMRSKIEAERVLREHSEGLEVTVLRLGVVYGPGKGQKISRIGYPVGSRFFVKVGLRDNVLPSTFVGNAVEALRLAGESPKAAGRVYNVVDDECFTQVGFIRAISRYSGRKARSVRFPFLLANLMGSTARRFASKNGIARRVSGLMSPFHLESCAFEVRYDNSRLKEELGWNPGRDLEGRLRLTHDPSAVEPPSPAPALKEEKVLESV